MFDPHARNAEKSIKAAALYTGRYGHTSIAALAMEIHAISTQTFINVAMCVVRCFGDGEQQHPPPSVIFETDNATTCLNRSLPSLFPLRYDIYVA